MSNHKYCNNNNIVIVPTNSYSGEPPAKIIKLEKTNQIVQKTCEIVKKCENQIVQNVPTSEKTKTSICQQSFKSGDVISVNSVNTSTLSSESIAEVQQISIVEGFQSENYAKTGRGISSHNLLVIETNGEGSESCDKTHELLNQQSQVTTRVDRKDKSVPDKFNKAHSSWASNYLESIGYKPIKLNMLQKMPIPKLSQIKDVNNDLKRTKDTHLPTGLMKPSDKNYTKKCLSLKQKYKDNKKCLDIDHSKCKLLKTNHIPENGSTSGNITTNTIQNNEKEIKLMPKSDTNKIVSLKHKENNQYNIIKTRTFNCENKNKHKLSYEDKHNYDAKIKKKVTTGNNDKVTVSKHNSKTEKHLNLANKIIKNTGNVSAKPNSMNSVKIVDKNKVKSEKNKLNIMNCSEQSIIMNSVKSKPDVHTLKRKSTTAIKSIVNVIDRLELNNLERRYSHSYSHNNKPIQDLRSKLIKKKKDTLKKSFQTNMRYKRNIPEIDMSENLRITVKQDEPNAEEQLPIIHQQTPDSQINSNSCPNIKLIINFVVNKNTDSSSDNESNNKQHFLDDEDLKFLDDFDIDDIVKCLNQCETNTNLFIPKVDNIAKLDKKCKFETNKLSLINTDNSNSLTKRKENLNPSDISTKPNKIDNNHENLQSTNNTASVVETKENNKPVDNEAVREIKKRSNSKILILNEMDNKSTNDIFNTHDNEINNCNTLDYANSSYDDDIDIISAIKKELNNMCKNSDDKGIKSHANNLQYKIPTKPDEIVDKGNIELGIIKSHGQENVRHNKMVSGINPALPNCDENYIVKLNEDIKSSIESYNTSLACNKRNLQKAASVYFEKEDLNTGFIESKNVEKYATNNETNCSVTISQTQNEISEMLPTNLHNLEKQPYYSNNEFKSNSPSHEYDMEKVENENVIKKDNDVVKETTNFLEITIDNNLLQVKIDAIEEKLEVVDLTVADIEPCSNNETNCSVTISQTHNEISEMLPTNLHNLEKQPYSSNESESNPPSHEHDMEKVEKENVIIKDKDVIKETTNLSEITIHNDLLQVKIDAIEEKLEVVDLTLDDIEPCSNINPSDVLRAKNKQNPPADTTISKDNTSLKSRAIIDTSSKHCAISNSTTPVPNSTTMDTESLTRKSVHKFPNELEALQNRLRACMVKDYEIISLINKGSFSKIYKIKTPCDVIHAVKVINNLSNGKRQSKILMKLQSDIPKEHYNCVYLLNAFKFHTYSCMVMEYYPKNLGDVIKKSKKPFHIEAVQVLSRQLISAVTMLRHNNIVHSDIKPYHILLSESNHRLKLCGFDMASYAHSFKLKQYTGTGRYRAPEILLGYQSDFSIDVWATAVVMYEMATKTVPFHGVFNNTILYKQLCVFGDIPHDMLAMSHLKGKHYYGNRFMLRSGYQGKTITLIDHFEKTCLSRSIIQAQRVHWMLLNRAGKNIYHAKLQIFNNLLEQMLVLHPLHRLTIEFVYANPFIYEVFA